MRSKGEGETCLGLSGQRLRFDVQFQREQTAAAWKKHTATHTHTLIQYIWLYSRQIEQGRLLISFEAGGIFQSFNAGVFLFGWVFLSVCFGIF